MENISKEQIVAGVFQFFDDLEFIEKLNDLTYSRKIQLKSKARNTFTTAKNGRE